MKEKKRTIEKLVDLSIFSIKNTSACNFDILRKSLNIGLISKHCKFSKLLKKSSIKRESYIYNGACMCVGGRYICLCSVIRVEPIKEKN